MAASSGVVRTRVGYCGGSATQPSYRKVPKILFPHLFWNIFLSVFLLMCFRFAPILNILIGQKLYK